MRALSRACIEAPCGDGTMPFRIWGDGTPLLLCHGGSGAWTHWVRNIEALSAHYRVIAPDLPGLGDAATLPAPYTPESAAAVTHAGLDRVLAPGERLHIAAFSWGCTGAALISGWRGAQVKSLFLVGPQSTGTYPRPAMTGLKRRSRGMDEAALREVARYNLQQLMIHDPARIDDLAVHVHLENTNRARFDSPQFSRTTTVLDGIRAAVAPVKVIYAEFDQPSYPYVEPRRQDLLAARPDLEFELVPGVGHWTQYEWPGFDACLLEWLARHD